MNYVIKSPHLLDQLLGLEYYITPTPPIEGPLDFRSRYDDFKVIELVGNKVNVIKLKHDKKWSTRYGAIAVYLLCKKGLSTPRALKILSRYLRISLKNIEYLGLKDTKAITYQLIFIKKFPDNIPGIIAVNDKLKAILLGYVRRKPKLWGNSFIITFRVLEDEEYVIDEALEYLTRTRVLPAYYGYQRFGTHRPITHVIGEYLIKGEWCKAVEYIILHPFMNESPEAINARLPFTSIEESLKIFSKHGDFDLETLVLSGYCSRSACLEILRRIPRRILLLYVSAYQSYVFNRTLSKMLTEDTISKLQGKTITIQPKVYYFLEDCIETMNSNNLKLLGLRLSVLRRPALMRVYDLEWSRRKNQDGFTTYRLRFSLEKGMYATIVLRELLKTDPLFLSG